MRAVWISPSERVCSPEELRAEGIFTETFDARSPQSTADRLRGELGWGRQDEVRLSVINPRDEATIAREIDEHLHLIQEVRLFLDGEGVYDVRASDERWVRIWVEPGDAVVIPEKRYHRVLPSTHGAIRYLQIYSERPGLTPLYRASSEETRAG
jgi:1,2-dihydroxy-3-keto-5-methylthiopentene dioxygenase